MRKITLFFALFAFISTGAFAQDDTTPTDEKRWKSGVGIGLDFAQLLQINPKVGAGENRIALGGAANAFANWKKDKYAWDNSVSWKIGVQKLGGGLSILNPDIKVPYQKSIDELRFDSKFGYAITENNKLYAATELSFLSQILKTHNGSYLKDITDTGLHPIAQFFSPGTITYSVGLDWKPNDNFSLYYSPIAIKAIVVADDEIAGVVAQDATTGTYQANTSLHGNPIVTQTDATGAVLGTPASFNNTLFLFGSLAKAQYQTKFWPAKDGDKEFHRILFKTYLSLYFDYLQGEKRNENPDYVTHIDTDWGTETAINVYKGLQIVLTTNLFYDWDVPVQETDYSQVGGVSGELVRKPSFTQQLLIKYSINF